MVLYKIYTNINCQAQNVKSFSSDFVQMSMSGYNVIKQLQWRHKESDGVSNHQRFHCLLNCLFRSKKTSKIRVTGLCEGNSPVTGEFPVQKTSNAENASIWRRHHAMRACLVKASTWAPSMTNVCIFAHANGCIRMLYESTFWHGLPMWALVCLFVRM